MTNFPRWSEWRKWDLHVHTLWTGKNDQFTSANFEKFCEELFRKAIEKDIWAIWITDYFSIDNYKKVITYVSDINSTSFNTYEQEKIKWILILPNVELRMLPATDSGRLVNIHCIFNPDIVSDLENNFFNKLEADWWTSTNFPMNRQWLIKLWWSLDPSLSTDKKKYEKWVNNFVVTHKDLKKLYDTNKAFRDNVLIAVSNSSNDWASAMQKHYDLFENEWWSLDWVRKAMYCMSNIIFSSNPNDREFFLWKKTTVNDVITKCWSIKPCIHWSDAHRESNLFCPEQNRYCWIKSDLSFEWLKQIIYEPADRVYIQEEIPRSPSLWIDNFQLSVWSDAKIWSYDSDSEYDFCLKWINDIFHLSKSFNCIIWTRWSWKSTLLNLFGLYSNNNEFSQEFWANKLRPVNYSIDKIAKLPEIIHQNFEYIPQNKIEEIAQDIDAITTMMKGRIMLYGWDDLDGLEQKIFEEKEKIDDKVDTYWTLIEKEQELKLIKSKIAKLTEIKKILNWKDFKDINEIIEKNITKKKALSEWKSEVEEFLSELWEFKLEEYEWDELTKYQIALNNAYKKVGEAIEILSSTDLEEEDKLLIQINKVIAENEDKLEELLKDKITVEEIRETKWVHHKISQLQDEMSELDQELEKLKGELKEDSKINTYALRYIESINDSLSPIIQQLSEEWEENPEHIQIISINSEYDFQSAREDIALEIYDMYSDLIEKVWLQNNFLNFINENKWLLDMWFSDQFKEILDKKIKEWNKTADFVKRIIDQTYSDEIFKLVIQKHLQDPVTYQKSHVTYWGKSLSNVSFWQRCTAAIVIMLLFGTNPIIIDEPEAHLDSKLIHDYLVPMIKKLKNKRQIIFATHNANFVINWDAEKIFILDDDAWTTSILETTIENLEHREYLLKLEWWAEAFSKRQQRYQV